MTPDQLLPCPFCGNAPVCPPDAGDDDFVVMCTTCGASSRYSDSRGEVITTWNKRQSYAPAVLREACLRLQQFLDTFGDLDGATTQADINDWFEHTAATSERERRINE